ncbi:hypothetical protein M3Y94_00790000 [Aphelenchoides besseyi]|nr:hypothetical protein M3Y94_00790000 [Aphelenchoides besseyi]KAI6232439.1 hypothetical protein M3Y95_00486000 [Aphelenchoides besseyi]
MRNKFHILVAFGLIELVFIVEAEKRIYSGDSTPYRTLPFYSPCTFPVPSSGDGIQTRENHRVCNVRKSMNFLCDLHFQLAQQNVNPIVRAYDAHRSLFEENGKPLLEIVLVKQLAAPSARHVNEIDSDDIEFGCLFRTPSLYVSREIIQKLAHSSKTFTKVYTAALFQRWFSKDECVRPKIMALVVLDGILSDPRKLTSVNIYTDNPEFALLISNIQLEAANALLQGVPLVAALTDLVELLAYALRDFNSSTTSTSPTHWRGHKVPLWAWELASVSVVLVVVALFIEWYLVRRSVAVKRSMPGLQVDAVRSKTHLIF